ncbi:MAG: tetratricopeptide repeat protein [Thiohalomonadales bacterium]
MTLVFSFPIVFSAETNQQDYIGSDSCTNCHQKQYNAWRGSFHEQAMQHTNKKTVLGDFNNIKFTYNAITTTFFKKGNRFFINTDDQYGKLKNFEIKYTFGVYPLQQYLIEFPGGRLQALGIAWDSREIQQGGQRWYHLYPNEKITFKHRLHWTQADQNWNYMCADCHSTNLQKNYNSDKNTYNTSWSELNVACEACHGPASQHVNWAKKKTAKQSIDQKNKGLVVDLDERFGVTWKIDPDTGNAKRSIEKKTNKEIEICARCHSRRSVISNNDAFNKPLLDNYLPALLTGFLYYPDGQIKEEVYVYGSFIQSEMYHQGVTCSDCHDPHSTQLRASGNNVCLQCHVKKKYDQTTHHFHKQNSKGALCAECHMPQTIYMGVDGRHDHSIRIPRPDLSITLKTPNACNNCHKDKTAKWASSKMENWYGKNWTPGWHFGETLFKARNGDIGINQDLAALAASPKFPVIARATATDLLQYFPGPVSSVVIQKLLKDKNPMIRLAALQTLDTIPIQPRLKAGFALLSDPVLAVRIEAARIFAIAPRNRLSPQQQSILDNAINEYQQAQRVNSDRPESLINLGLLAIRLQQFSEAEKYYQQALKLDPGFINAYVNLADLYRSQQQENKAEQVLKQALQISKENADIHHALGLLYVRKKQMIKALSELKTAYQLQMNNARYGYIYAVALNSRSQTERAIKILLKVHQQHPSDIDTVSALVSFYRNTNRLHEALVYARKLQVLIPGNPEITKLIQSLQ